MKRKILSLAFALMMIISVAAALPVGAVETASDNPLKFYAKDYHTKAQGVDFRADGVVSGRELKADPSVVIPDVTIPTSGDYYVIYNAGAYTGASYCKIKFNLGETFLGENTNGALTYREALSYGNTAYNMPMRKYIKKVNLTAGTYDLAVNISTTHKSYIFQWEYIEFVEADSLERRHTITSEPSKIEFEDHGYLGVVKPVEGASGGKIVDTSSWDGFSADPSIVIPITIEETGYYEVSTVVSEPGASVSNITLKIGDTTVASNGDASVEKMTYGGTFGTTATSSKYLELNRYKKGDLYFEAGNYELVVTIAPGSDGPYKFSLDYVEFVKVNKPLVSTAGATKIEAEIAKYFDENFSAAISTKTTASGGQFLYSGGATVDPSFSFPVVIEEAGLYDFRYLVGAEAATDSVSTVTIMLDDMTVGVNRKTPNITYQKEADLRANYNSAFASYMPVYSYINRGIELEAKEYTLTVTVDQTADKMYKYQIDCFEFIPTQKPVVSKDGTTRIEAEIAEVYTTDFGATYTALDTASACGYLYGDSQKAEPITFEIPVVVEEAGFYDFRYVLGHMIKYTSIVTVKIKKGDDEVAVFDNSAAGELNLSENYHAGYDDTMPVYQYTQNGIKLDEGEYTIAVEIAKNGDYCKYQIDYFEFIPLENTVEIDGISIKAEAYIDEAVSGVPVLALYSDGVLAYLTVGETVSDTNHIEIYGACAEGLTYTDAKIFVWQDAVTSLAPVCKPVILQ